MEIKCPHCTGTLEFTESGRQAVCPHCNAPLDVEHLENGFALISAAPIAASEKEKQPPPDDPIIEDYTKWRSRAVFGMLFGGACALILSLSITHGIVGSGRYYLKDPKNLFFIVIIGIFSVCCVAGGGWLFRHLGKERDRYIRVRDC